jgi:hypothetical protein
LPDDALSVSSPPRLSFSSLCLFKIGLLELHYWTAGRRRWFSNPKTLYFLEGQEIGDDIVGRAI